MTARFSMLMVSGEYPPMISGVGDYAGHVAQTLARNDCVVHVVSSNFEGLPQEKNESGVVVHRTITKWQAGCWADIESVLHCLAPPIVVAIQYNCPRAYRRHLAINLLPLVIRIRRIGVSVISVIHGFREQSLLYRMRTIPMLMFSHGVVCVDKQNCAPLRLYSLGRPRIQYIPISGNIPEVAVNAARRSEIRTSLGFSPQELVVVFFGGIGRTKGIEYLIEAVELLRARGTKSLRLLLLGGFQKDGVNEYYQSQIKQRIVSDNRERWIHVEQTPSRVRVSELLQAADVAVYPFADGVGENSGSLLAAMEHGLPCIVTSGQISLPPEFPVVRVPSCNKIQIANSIERLVDYPEQRLTLGKEARTFTDQRSWKHVAKYFTDFCGQIIGSRGV